MSQEPKKRHSRQRQGKRRASIHLEVPNSATCLNCGHKNKPHSVCSKCGYYKGVEVIAMQKSVTESQNENPQ